MVGRAPSGPGPSGVMGAKTPGVGVEESSVEVGPGEVAVGSSIVVPEGPAPNFWVAHEATRKAALTSAKLENLCLFIGTISPLLPCRPTPDAAKELDLAVDEGG